MPDTWRAPTHQVAGAVGDPGYRSRGQQGAASCEAEGRGAPQHPEGGVHHALAGVGGSEQAQLRPEGEGEEPSPGAKGAAGGPAGRPPEPVLADTGERGHVELGHCRRQGPPHSPRLGPRVGRGLMWEAVPFGENSWGGAQAWRPAPWGGVQLLPAPGVADSRWPLQHGPRLGAAHAGPLASPRDTCFVSEAMNPNWQSGYKWLLWPLLNIRSPRVA